LEKYREDAEKLLKKVDGYGEIRIERRVMFRISVENGAVKNISRTIDMGGFVRVLLKNHGWGTATFNAFEELPRAFEDAVSASRIILPDSPIRLVESEPGEYTVKVDMDDPFDAHSDREKLETILRYNETLRAGWDKIIQANTHYYDDHIEKLYLNTCGVMVHDFYFPAPVLRVLAIHPEQVAGKQGGLVSTRACPDFEEYVVIVIRVFWQKQQLQRAFQFFKPLIA